MWWTLSELLFFASDIVYFKPISVDAPFRSWFKLVIYVILSELFGFSVLNYIGHGPFFVSFHPWTRFDLPRHLSLKWFQFQKVTKSSNRCSEPFSMNSLEKVINMWCPHWKRLVSLSIHQTLVSRYWKCCFIHSFCINKYLLTLATASNNFQGAFDRIQLFVVSIQQRFGWLYFAWICQLKKEMPATVWLARVICVITLRLHPHSNGVSWTVDSFSF